MVNTTATSTVEWDFDVSKAPTDGTRVLVAWRDDLGNTGVCEAAVEAPFGYGATKPGWFCMSGEATGMGDASVPGTVYAWAPMMKAPQHFR